MDMLETLFDLHILYQITCLCPYLIERKTWTLKKSKFLEVYALSVIAISLSLMLFSLLVEKNVTQTGEKKNLEQPVKILLILGVRVAHITSVCEGLFRKKYQMKFYEELKIVDRIFECSLNIDVKNKEFLRSTILFGFLMLFVYLAAEVYLLVLNASSYEEHLPLFWCFRMMPLSVCGLRYFQIFTTIRILKHRFELLENILSQINLEAQAKENRDVSPKNVTSKKVALNCKYSLALVEAPIFRGSTSCDMESPALKRLLTVRDLYNRLYHLNEILNCNFGLSMLINLANDFISITTACYWIFYNYHDYMTNSFLLMASNSIWSLPHLVNVIVLALLCESVVQKTNKIALNLHRINIDIRNDNHNSVIEQFSLQLLHQEITISAAGFFNINCTLLYSIVGATTTYLVILIQFHMSDTKSDHGHQH